MLRAEIGEHGIRKMAFHQLGRPVFPMGEYFGERVKIAGGWPGVAAKQLKSCRWRAGASVEQRNGDFAPGKRLVQHWQISDHEGKKSEAHPALNHGHKAAQRRSWSDIAKSERKQRGSTEVERVPEVVGKNGAVELFGIAIM